MKKVKFVLLIILALFVLGACEKDPLRVDISSMPTDQKQSHEKMLEENFEKYKKTSEKMLKTEYAGQVAYEYMVLGNYRDAIKYYEEVLTYNSLDFPALNNMAIMYENIGEVLKALEYQKKLYDANPTNRKVVQDTIRILLKNGHTNNAEGVLLKFSEYDKKNGNNYTKFISDQYQSILDAK